MRIASNILYIVLFTILSLFVVCYSQGTTPFIQQVFVGKCYEKNPSGVNCTLLWDSFSQAAEINNYNNNNNNYIPFFNNANFSTPNNGILFWSGNMAFALSISNVGGQFTTVEGTSTGYVLNGMSWCGTTDNTFDYSGNCLYESNATTKYYGMSEVWKQSSHEFAEGASGDITVLLEPIPYLPGGPSLAFRNNSIFALVELPSLNTTKVTGITILLLPNNTAAPYEICGNGSLTNLSNIIHQKFGYYPRCIDNPKKIYEILCPDGNTSTPECLTALMAYNNYKDAPMPRNEKNYLIWALFMTVTTCAAIVIATYMSLRVYKLEHSSYNTIS